MNTSKKGLALIKRFEGLRLTAYLCPAKVWTIGYGHTKGVAKGQKITKEQAEEYLKRDLAIYEAAVERGVKVKLNQDQFDALVSFTYNVGVSAFNSSTLLKLVNEKKFKEAAEQFPKWVYADGIILPGLQVRRDVEKKVFLGNAITDKDFVV